MSAFLAMNYDSDSDSADDLDFQPASDASNSASSSSDEESGPEDENMEEVMPEDEGSSQAPPTAAPTPEPKPAKTAKKMSKKKATAVIDDVKPQPKKRGRKPKVVNEDTPRSKPAKAKATKKASKSTSAVAASAISAIRSPFDPSVQIDMDHPLETFKWPYSPFTSEFKEQHRARDKLVHDLRLAVQEIKGTNTHANRHLQDLDNRLQLSRQDLSTCLDEIQFRKSQLRDMSLMAVDIVKKLSRQPLSSSPLMSQPGAQDGAEDMNGSVIPNSTGMSHVDHQMMDVDQESSGDDLSGSSHSPSLKGLNEGNVRSFLEKIRELEHAQRPLA